MIFKVKEYFIYKPSKPWLIIYKRNIIVESYLEEIGNSKHDYELSQNEKMQLSYYEGKANTTTFSVY